MPSAAIHVLSLALCLSSGFQQGYIASVLNQPYAQIQNYINESWVHTVGSPIEETTMSFLWSTLNVCFPIATIFGQAAATLLVSRLGRKKTAILSCLLYIPGTLLSAAAKWIPNAFELLFVGRILWSLANGIASVNATVWIVECAPAEVRGRMAAMQEFFMAIGSLMTQALGVPFATEEWWDMNFVPNTVIVFVNLFLFFFVSESPQFLIEKKQKYEEARKALSAYHGVPPDHPSVEEEIQTCEQSIQKKLEKKKLTVSQKHSYGPGSLAIMFNPWKASDPASQVIRQNAWVGLMVKIAYVFTGARCLRGYSAFILEKMGGWDAREANLGSLFVGLLRVPITLVPVFLVDHLGRRPLILGSAAISFLSIALMHTAIIAGPSWKIATLAGLTVLLLINACGIGSISRFYCAEVVPRAVLLQSVSTLTQLEAVTKISVEFAFYPLATLIGPNALLLFSLPTLFLFVLMWKLCPETSRKSVNEVLNEVAEKKGLDVKF